jgi:hypothetical protein
MVRGAGCREPNPRIRRREKNVLDMPSYRSGRYTPSKILSGNLDELGRKLVYGGDGYLIAKLA